MRRALLASLSGVLLLAGCGQIAQTSASLPRRGTGAPLGSAAPLGAVQAGTQVQPGALTGNPQADGQMLLNGMRQTVAQITGFSAELKSYSEGNYKSGERKGELFKSTTRSKVTWAKPARLRAEVITATNPLLEGGALATPDGQNITARAKGLLSIIPIHLQASDPKLSNNRNYKFNDMNPNVLIGRLTGATAQWTVVGPGQIGTASVLWVSVAGVRHLDAEIQTELIAVDPQTYALNGVQMMAGNKRVVDMQLTNFQWNPTVSASMFQL